MNFPSASPNENMNIDSSINPMAGRRAERSSAAVEILANRLMDDRGVFPSWPDLFRPYTSFTPSRFKDVDARHKAGHDELRGIDCRRNTSATPIGHQSPRNAPQEIRHDRARSRRASHGATTTLVRGFCAGRAFCHSQPHPDDGSVFSLSGGEQRYASG